MKHEPLKPDTIRLCALLFSIVSMRLLVSIYSWICMINVAIAVQLNVFANDILCLTPKSARMRLISQKYIGYLNVPIILKTHQTTKIPSNYFRFHGSCFTHLLDLMCIFFSCYFNATSEFLWIYNIFNWCEIENILWWISVLNGLMQFTLSPYSLFTCGLHLFYSLVVVVRSLIIWFLDCGIYNYFPVNQVYYIQNHNVTTQQLINGLASCKEFPPLNFNHLIWFIVMF